MRTSKRSPTFRVLDEILAQIEVDPDVVEIDQGNERHARRDIFARLDIALIDLRGDGGIDHESDR